MNYPNISSRFLSLRWLLLIDRGIQYTYAQISLANLAEPGLLSARDDKK